MKKFLMAKLVSLVLIGQAYAIQKPRQELCVLPSMGVVATGPKDVQGQVRPILQQPEESVSNLQSSCETPWSGFQYLLGSIHPIGYGPLSILRRESDGRGPTQKRSGLHATQQRAVLWNVQSNEAHALRTRVPSTSETHLRAPSLSVEQLAKVEQMAYAIARTEGFFQKGSLPNRLHNPGDIKSSLSNAYPGQVGLYRGYVKFVSDRAGWRVLENQITAIVLDESKEYTRSMTFGEIAKVYATSPQWPKTLCKILQISPDETFKQFMEGNRNVNTTLQTGPPINREEYIYDYVVRRDSPVPTDSDILSEMQTGTSAWSQEQPSVYGGLVTP
jgi:hypothetical protein